MKPFILLTLSASLIAPGFVVAQPMPVQPSPAQGRQARPASPQVQRPRPDSGRPQIQPPRPGNGGPQIQPPRPSRPDVRPPRPPHYRPPFHYPHGYQYRRWHAGLVLPSLFLASHYGFHDYAAYGVPYPPHGYHWVRYGPDLVLVNNRNGRIRDVRYGVFL